MIKFFAVFIYAQIVCTVKHEIQRNFRTRRFITIIAYHKAIVPQLVFHNADNIIVIARYRLQCIRFIRRHHPIAKLGVARNHIHRRSLLIRIQQQALPLETFIDVSKRFYGQINFFDSIVKIRFRAVKFYGRRAVGNRQFTRRTIGVPRICVHTKSKRRINLRVEFFFRRRTHFIARRRRHQTHMRESVIFQSIRFKHHQIV